MIVDIPAPDAADAAPRATLSVVLCTFDGAPWLPEFLRSLAEQTRPPDELIVQDDASGDATVELVEAFARDAAFPVRLEVNPTTIGSTSNFELALKRSTGQIVALADQDDIWYPEKLDRLAEALEEDPILTLAFSDADLVDEDGRPLGASLWDRRGIGRLLRGHEIVPGSYFARRALTTGCTMAARRRAVDAALPFPASIDDAHTPMRHDRWLSLVAASVGTVRALPEHLLAFRVHRSQQTGVLTPQQFRSRLLAAAADVLGPDAGDRSEEHRCRAEQLGAAADRADRLGDFEEADRLRRVAEHHRMRADLGPTRRARASRVCKEVADGGYDLSLLGLASVAADSARALRAGPRRGS